METLRRAPEPIQWYSERQGEWEECFADYGNPKHQHPRKWIFDPNLNCLVMPEDRRMQ